MHVNEVSICLDESIWPEIAERPSGPSSAGPHFVNLFRNFDGTRKRAIVIAKDGHVIVGCVLKGKLPIVEHGQALL
jgi:hypothetical protein